MNLLENFKKEFEKRHDFISHDLDLLYKKHPTVSFLNIPEAWIVPIDEMLFKLNYKKISHITISQHYGQFIVSTPVAEFKLKYIKIIDETRRIIESIDRDLYENLNTKSEDIFKKMLEKNIWSFYDKFDG